MKTVDPRLTTANIPVYMLRSLVATLMEHDLDVSKLLVGIGLTLTDIEDAECRVSFRQGREVILRALEMAQGHALGLETGFRQKINSVGLVGYAMLTSATVGDAVKLGLQFQKNTGSMLEFDTKVTEDGIAVTAASRFSEPAIYTFLVEEAFANFMTIGIGLVGDGFKPLRIELAYPEPAHSSAYKEIFGCEVRFGTMENVFLFDPTWYKQPLATSDPFSNRQLREFIAYHHDRTREAVETTEAVERVLRQRLQKRVSIARVAKALGMSERTLRRRLAEASVSFQGLLDELRKKKALELLSNPHMSVEQIAFAVGFTDPHNFRRAFRRWTGTTPGVLRSDIMRIWPK
ncbi:AraC family transcriptional regulator [Oryzifoliimicrobium ureilyticus]|uniref:AraC family transcriptional regulator n=1 Tax=Oryzifoliimicrobium ureilyticus TaxID=3113724 RepID=UPI0030760726